MSDWDRRRLLESMACGPLAALLSQGLRSVTGQAVISAPKLVSLLPTVHAAAALTVEVSKLEDVEGHELLIETAPCNGRLTGYMPAESGGKLYMWRDTTWPEEKWGPKSRAPDPVFLKHVALVSSIASLKEAENLPDWDSPRWGDTATLQLGADGKARLACRGFSLGGGEEKPAADKISYRVRNRRTGRLVDGLEAHTIVESGVLGMVEVPPINEDCGLYVKKATGYEPNVYVRSEVLSKMELVADAFGRCVRPLRTDRPTPLKPLELRPELVVTEASTKWGGLPHNHKTHRSGIALDLRYPSVALPEDGGVHPAAQSYQVKCGPVPPVGRVPIEVQRFSKLGTRVLAHILHGYGAYTIYLGCQEVVDAINKEDKLKNMRNEPFAKRVDGHYDHLHVAWGRELKTFG
jgi:hypothetical protein